MGEQLMCIFASIDSSLLTCSEDTARNQAEFQIGEPDGARVSSLDRRVMYERH